MVPYRRAPDPAVRVRMAKIALDHDHQLFVPIETFFTFYSDEEDGIVE